MLKQEQLRKFIVLIDQLVELILQGNICWIRDVTGLTLDDLRLYRERAMTELRIIEHAQLDRWRDRE